MLNYKHICASCGEHENLHHAGGNPRSCQGWRQLKPETIDQLERLDDAERQCREASEKAKQKS